MADLRLIGYWRGEYARVPWPDVRNFVDPMWSTTTRELVAAYLVRGRKLRQYRGLSPCRFCGRDNGSQEFTDGVFLWPEGLAHYVSDHDVRLPEEFARHVEASVSEGAIGPDPGFDQLGQRVRHTSYDEEYDAWIIGSRERFELFRLTGVASPPDWLSADIDIDWWKAQVGWTATDS